MSLIERESPEQIEYIWNEFHKDKSENISLTMKKPEFELFEKNTKTASNFIIPVKRKSGHFMMFTQKQENSILMTYLEDYKI